MAFIQPESVAGAPWITGTPLIQSKDDLNDALVDDLDVFVGAARGLKSGSRKFHLGAPCGYHVSSGFQRVNQ